MLKNVPGVGYNIGECAALEELHHNPQFIILTGLQTETECIINWLSQYGASNRIIPVQRGMTGTSRRCSGGDGRA